jgi:GT2 family glycosyltransferase
MNAKMSCPSLSVVIPTFRRDDLLRRCLGSLLEQELQPGSFEIIVVDDACSDTVAPVISELATAAGPAITLLPGRQRGPATARNIGWRAARGEIVAFIDDDAYPADAHWLAEGLSMLRDPSVAAVTGCVVVPVPERPTDFQRNVKNLETAAFLTCNAFVRRKVLEGIGGFDERFRVPYREDSDLQFRIEEAGGTIRHNPDAIVIHPAPPGAFGVSLRLQRYNRYNALAFKKHPERYRRQLQPWPPLSYYAMVVLSIAALALFAVGLVLIAAAAAIAWLALYLEFLRRRLRGTSRDARHILDMALTSVLIPYLAVYWRLRGALQFRVPFV